MEGQLVWKDEYNIGVDIIDREHKRLFKIINKLFRFTDEKNKSQWACQEGIKFFKDHAVNHFTEEEEYMASIHYERLGIHMHIHSEFRERTLPALEEELERTDYCADSVEHFLGVCAGWLVGHTLMEDCGVCYILDILLAAHGIDAPFPDSPLICMGIALAAVFRFHFGETIPLAASLVAAAFSSRKFLPEKRTGAHRSMIRS